MARISETWETQKWLIGRRLANVAKGLLEAENADATLATSDLLKTNKLTPAQKRARRSNGKKAARSNS